MKNYVEHVFKSIKEAQNKVSQIKKRYGYKPSIFKVTNPKTKLTKYVVVKPKNLVRVM